MSDLDKLDNVQNFVQKWVDWAKQNTMIAGFIIAGLLLGPSGFGWMQDANTIRMLAEIGLIFLLFSNLSHQRQPALKQFFLQFIFACRINPLPNYKWAIGIFGILRAKKLHWMIKDNSKSWTGNIFVTPF